MCNLSEAASNGNNFAFYYVSNQVKVSDREKLTKSGAGLRVSGP